MAVARISISLPLVDHRSFLDMVKRYKTTKSKMVLDWIKAKQREERNLKLKAEFDAVAKDPSYQKEAQEFANMVSSHYARNIAPNDAYSSKKG